MLIFQGDKFGARGLQDLLLLVVVKETRAKQGRRIDAITAQERLIVELTERELDSILLHVAPNQGHGLI